MPRRFDRACEEAQSENLNGCREHRSDRGGRTDRSGRSECDDHNGDVANVGLGDCNDVSGTNTGGNRCSGETSGENVAAERERRRRRRRHCRDVSDVLEESLIPIGTVTVDCTPVVFKSNRCPCPRFFC